MGFEVIFHICAINFQLNKKKFQKKLHFSSMHDLPIKDIIMSLSLTLTRPGKNRPKMAPSIFHSVVDKLSISQGKPDS